MLDIPVVFGLIPSDMDPVSPGPADSLALDVHNCRPLTCSLWFATTGDATKVRKMRAKEIANARLAMLAVLGAIVQANVTGARPFDNLFSHLADPGHNTIFQVR